MKPSYTLAALGSLTALFVMGGSAVKASPPPEPQRLAQTQPLDPSPGTIMTPERLIAILENEATNVRSQGNQWQLDLENQTLLVIFDEASDRMRILTPVIPAAELTPEQVGNTLIANFHTALDARYAVTDNMLVSLFVHPLSTLHEDDLRSALRQVASLANNFGTTYSSEAIIFGPDAQPAPERDFGIEGETAI